MRKPASVVVVIVALALGGWRIWKMDQEARVVKAQQEAAKTVAAEPVKAEATGAGKPGVRRLSKAERRALRAKIDAAIARERATARGASGARGGSGGTVDDDPVIPLEQVGKQAQEALQAAIPILAGCYAHGGSGSAAGKTALAQLTMISDPELGMVIDTSGITGGDGGPIAPAIDSCLRDAIESLALPPLGVPGKLPLQYSFRFE